MHHHFLGIDLSARAETDALRFDAFAARVGDQLTADAIDAFARGGAGFVRRMGYSDQPGKVIGEPVAEAVSDYLDTDGPRMLGLMAALQASADGRPEARLMAQAWIAGFARKHADDWADEIAANDPTVRA